VQVSARGAKFLVALESVVGFPLADAQGLKLLHLPVVFFRAGEKLDDAGFENLVSAGGLFLQFNAART
jgi:hypothetical protein